MWWKPRQRTPSDNPDVVEAMEMRDELLAESWKAIKRVDRLMDELLAEYREANGVKKEKE